MYCRAKLRPLASRGRQLRRPLVIVMSWMAVQRLAPEASSQALHWVCSLAIRPPYPGEPRKSWGPLLPWPSQARSPLDARSTLFRSRVLFPWYPSADAITRQLWFRSAELYKSIHKDRTEPGEGLPGPLTSQSLGRQGRKGAVPAQATARTGTVVSSDSREAT